MGVGLWGLNMISVRNGSFSFLSLSLFYVCLASAHSHRNFTTKVKVFDTASFIFIFCLEPHSLHPGELHPYITLFSCPFTIPYRYLPAGHILMRGLFLLLFFFFLDLLEKIIRYFLMSPRQASAAVGAIAVGPLLGLLVSCAGFISSLLALRVMGSFFAVKRGVGLSIVVGDSVPA